MAGNIGNVAGQNKDLFPWRLHQMLRDTAANGHENIVSWRPDGKSFKVHLREAFLKEILPDWFRQTHFKSFVRQLNLWGFRCVGRGANKGAYFHELFVRNEPHLCAGMERIKIKGAITKRKKKPAVSTPAPTMSATEPGTFPMLDQMGVSAGLSELDDVGQWRRNVISQISSSSLPNPVTPASSTKPLVSVPSIFHAPHNLPPFPTPSLRTAPVAAPPIPNIAPLNPNYDPRPTIQLSSSSSSLLDLGGDLNSSSSWDTGEQDSDDIESIDYTSIWDQPLLTSSSVHVHFEHLDLLSVSEAISECRQYVV